MSDDPDVPTSVPLSDVEITAGCPTEREDDRDAGGEGTEDAGDEESGPTKADDDRNAGSEGTQDKGYA